MLKDIQQSKWVISLYFLEGLPYVFITTVVPILYKNLNISNQTIGLYTSLFSIPWLLKPFISPFLETITTKKRIIIFTQTINGLLLFLLSLFLFQKSFLLSSCILFSIFALSAATYDIAADGFYLSKLTVRQQAYFVGIRTIGYQLGRLTSQGLLIILAGYFLIFLTTLNAWRFTFIITALLIFCITIFHYFALVDKIQNEVSKNLNTHIATFKNILKAVTDIPYYGLVLFFVFIFNFPEAQLMKMLPLFLLDHPNVGGLGLDTQTVGFIYGVLGTLAVIAGVSCAGLSTKKYPLKKIFIPISFLYSLSTLFLVIISLGWLNQRINISFSIILIQFFYGFANGLYMIFLLHNFSKGKYSMSMYAIASTLMMAGMIFASACSGYIQEFLGYKDFFIWISLNSLLILGLMKRSIKSVL